jgi:hypothetical protein
MCPQIPAVRFSISSGLPDLFRMRSVTAFCALFAVFAMGLGLTVSSTAAHAASGCGFNVDALPIADPNALSASDLTNDGLLISRYLRGVRDGALIAGTRGQSSPNLATAVAAHMATYQTTHDMDASGTLPDSNDGLIISRYLAGFRGASLTVGLSLTGTRSAFTSIESYIASGCDAAATTVRQLIFIHPDVKGSPLMATDTSGHPLWREDFSAFGERKKNENR